MARAGASSVERLVEWGLRVRWQDFPENVRETVRAITADCVGCALGGRGSRKSRAAVGWSLAAL